VQAWRALMGEPFVASWRPSDHATAVRWMHLLNRLYLLIDDPSSSPGALKALAGEVRSLERELGASPMARANLRWDVESARPAPTGVMRTVRLSDIDD
jgi:hypothetical protein